MSLNNKASLPTDLLTDANVSRKSEKEDKEGDEYDSCEEGEEEEGEEKESSNNRGGDDGEIIHSSGGGDNVPLIPGEEVSLSRRVSVSKKKLLSPPLLESRNRSRETLPSSSSFWRKLFFSFLFYVTYILFFVPIVALGIHDDIAKIINDPSWRTLKMKERGEYIERKKILISAISQEASEEFVSRENTLELKRLRDNLVELNPEIKKYSELRMRRKKKQNHPENGGRISKRNGRQGIGINGNDGDDDEDVDKRDDSLLRESNIALIVNKNPGCCSRFGGSLKRGFIWLITASFIRDSCIMFFIIWTFGMLLWFFAKTINTLTGLRVNVLTKESLPYYVYLSIAASLVLVIIWYGLWNMTQWYYNLNRPVYIAKRKWSRCFRVFCNCLNVGMCYCSYKILKAMCWCQCCRICIDRRDADTVESDLINGYDFDQDDDTKYDEKYSLSNIICGVSCCCFRLCGFCRKRRAYDKVFGAGYENGNKLQQQQQQYLLKQKQQQQQQQQQKQFKFNAKNEDDERLMDYIYG